ncbi:dipeptidyl peptidase family member 6-like [Ptychodera flava]|uniref:dipeptidyl peptidase family member 6-like n=1 Tax=Ptychodera flava TaxID=63121 RepID=UPI00396A938F
MTSVKVSEYGSWKSPITSALVTQGGVGLGYDSLVQIDDAGQEYADVAYWAESRFDEAGRVVICSKRLGAEQFEVWTPKGFNVRSRCHEYGGGSYFVHGSSVYFCNFADNRMYVQKSSDDEPTPLTPADCGWRYADGQISEKLNRILCVREDHSGIETGKTKEAVNTVIMIMPDTKEQKVLSQGVSGWYNAVLDTMESPKYEKEIGGPQWQFGPKSYVFDPQDSRKVAITYEGKIEIFDLTSKESTKLETGFTSHDHLCYSYDGYIYCRAGSPVKFKCIIRVNAKTGKTDILRESRSSDIDEGYLSVAEPITFPTADNDVAHAYFYPPKNKDFKAPEGSLPPLLVQIHGGPTAACSPDLNLNHQYFTSRGFALLDVNYRGSTGYGTKYRNKLRGNWGVHDIEDSCHGALYLANEAKKVDPKRLAISGGSAGGYTTLACLTFKDVFKAGVSHYGVGNLEALATDTHKFESRYLDTIIGKYPEEKHVYIDRSPVHFADKLNASVAFFQGEDDKVVLPNQAEEMFSLVKAKGLPTAYVLFPGEGHGFRKSENIQASMDGEFYFYSKVFSFEPAETPYEMDIINLK